MRSSSLDAEGEDDLEMEDAQENISDAEGSDMDAEGEEEDSDEGEVVGAVKKRAARRTSSRRSGRRAASASEESASDADSGSDSSESSSDAEGEWEGESETAEEAEVDNTGQNRCIFCGQDEEHDPNPEYEEYLSCAVCGDHAHKQCARDASALDSEQDTKHWRCKDCVSNGLEEENTKNETTAHRRRSSVPKIARDLLPAARGGIKPDSHSVFNTLILDDDPMDGSRALRKRKSVTDDSDEPPRPATRKRRRTSASSEAHSVVNVALLDGAASGNEQGSREGSDRLRTRPRRSMKSMYGLARVVSSEVEEPRSLIIAIPITAAALENVERNAQKKQRRRERDRERRARANNRAVSHVEEEIPQHYPAIQTTMYSNPFYAFPDRETDELKGKPYGGILTEAEADTSKTYPQQADREIFEAARRKAEDEWKKKLEAASAETPARTKSSGPPSKIKCINFGGYEIDTWHAAPYPEEYSRNRVLYICEFCLKYMNSDFVAWRHKLKCPAKHPPGDEIYRNTIQPTDGGPPTTLSFWEVDGRRNSLYCQNLCLLAKLFLGSKTLYYDVEPFLFYVMTENDVHGCHFVGYFSKEKRGLGPMPSTMNDPFADSAQSQAGSSAHPSTSDPALSNPGNNVSCILVLPVHMRRGFGRVLIEFSYLLTRVEGRTGSPEKPLSDMGLVSYRSYWRYVLCRLLLRYRDIASKSTARPPSITSIAKETGMTPDDIISTLEALRFLVRDPVTKTYALRLDYDYMAEYVDKNDKRKHITIDPDKLIWTPYVMGRPTNYFPIGEEATGHIQTKARRDEPSPPAPPNASETQHASLQNGDAMSADVDEKDIPIESISPRMRKRTPPRLAPSPQPFATQDSPNRRSPRRTQPGTETPNGIGIGIDHERQGDEEGGADAGPEASPTSSTAGSHIPPTRFEVFPPIPGMVAKRRPGRPFGSRTGRRTSTPYRRANGSPGQAGVGRSSASVRRTRSKLGEVVSGAEVRVQGGEEAGEVEEAVEDEVEEGGEEVGVEG